MIEESFIAYWETKNEEKYKSYKYAAFEAWKEAKKLHVCNRTVLPGFPFLYKTDCGIEVEGVDSRAKFCEFCGGKSNHVDT